MFLYSPASDKKPERIISLVPSITELLHFLELEKEVAAITRFCVHPSSWFQSKTRIGGTKALDTEKIRALQPDLIIANKEENVKEQIGSLSEFPVWLTDVNDITEALQMIGDIGRLTHTTPKAAALINSIKEGFSQLIPGFTPVKAAYFIWKDPYMVAGGDTFINSMMEAAGFKNVFGHLTRYPQVSMRQLEAAGCEVILLSSEPYPFKEKHQAELKNIFPDKDILLVDGEMFSWYGSRMLPATEYFRKQFPLPADKYS